MATSGFGSFAAPPPINPLAAANPLQDLIAGLQQGLQLRQLPQQLADQELQKRLNNALLAQKLADLQNPEAALTRQITQELALKGALNPDLGIERAPSGLTGETIYNPQAVPFTGNELENALRENLGMAVPTAPQLQPTTPIAPFGIQTGLNLNPNIPVQAAERDLTRDLTKAQKESDIIQARQIEVDKKKEENKAKLPPRIVAKQEGNFIVKRDYLTQERVGEPEPIPKDSHFVTIANVGSGYVNEQTQKFTPIEGTQPQAPTGGAKLSADESKGLVAAASQGGALQRMVEQYDALAKEGKAGIVGGTKERGKQLIGMGGEDFSKANAEIQGNLFGLARALQGGGVLTEQDLIRMQDLVQPINVERPQFVGSLKGVGQVMIDKIDGFLAIRGDAVPPDLRAKIDKVRSELSASDNLRAPPNML